MFQRRGGPKRMALMNTTWWKSMILPKRQGGLRE